MNAPVHSRPRHFLDLLELSSGELRGILDRSASMKAARLSGAERTWRPLAGKTLAMIFDRPSTRTRVSFDVGMRDRRHRARAVALRRRHRHSNPEPGRHAGNG
jgi:ornithine carbamoyltransferase